MNIKLSERVINIPEYIFSRLARDVAEVEISSGRKVLSFGAGTPDVRPSKLYLQKLSGLIQEKDSHVYPGYKAIPEFSGALINWYKRRFGTSLEDSGILPLLGAKDGITHLPLALLDPGDEVLIPDPGYPAFSTPASMAGAKRISYDLLEKNNYAIDLGELQSKITKRTKFMWVNFPSNPTGQVATIDELKELVKFAQKNNLLIAYDNAYSEITFDAYNAPSILQVKGAKDVAVEIGSFSKTFSFAGFRMGWIVGNKNVISAIAKVKSQMDSGLSLPLQKLGAFALNHYDKSWHDKMISSYETRRNVIARFLGSIGLIFDLPKGSLYIWAKIPGTFKNSEEFCKYYLRDKQILFTPGSAFGKNGDRFIRVSICVNIDNINNYF